MAEPKCPSCAVEGSGNIVSSFGNPKKYLEIAHCDKCGHIYGVFRTQVNVFQSQSFIEYLGGLATLGDE
jgi:hypothetical protein